MLANRKISGKYRAWNARWGAPFGNELHLPRQMAKRLPHRLALKLRGPYSLQRNNDTRIYEYPWAYYASSLEPGMRVLEIGGGLSGFQFTLSKLGMDVVNVDPGSEAKGKGWPCEPETFRELNTVFRTSVELRSTTIENAGLADGSFDRIYSISVLEHLDPTEVEVVIDHAARCLRPGGLFVVTADLFLDLKPFTTRESNEWGRNYSLERFWEHRSFDLTQGNQAELFGGDEFSADTIQANLSKYLIGGKHPTLTQCFVIRRHS